MLGQDMRTINTKLVRAFILGEMKRQGLNIKKKPCACFCSADEKATEGVRGQKTAVYHRNGRHRQTTRGAEVRLKLCVQENHTAYQELV